MYVLVGALVGGVGALGVGLLMVRFGPVGRWLWTHGAAADGEFDVGGSPEEVVSAAAALAAAHRGWREIHRHRTSLWIAGRPTGWSLAKRITVRAQPSVGGSHVWVQSRTPQLLDWGENRRVVAALARAMSGGPRS